MEKGDTKTQHFLRVAATGNRADVPEESIANTKTQNLIIGVADRIVTEEETRLAADRFLQGEIDDIKNNPDVVDVVATYAALQAYDTSTLTDKDVIRVLADETHDGASTYYRYNASTNTFTYIGAAGDYYTKTQTDALLSAKQDVLTAGEHITIADQSGALVISADSGGEYTAGSGIDITNDIISATNTGKAKVLATDDYNWNTTAGDSTTTPFDSVALWLLEPGMYLVPSGVNGRLGANQTTNTSSLYVVSQRTGYGTPIFSYYYNSAGKEYGNARVVLFDGTVTQDKLYFSVPVDNLTSTDNLVPLSAKQGKVLKDLVDGNLGKSRELTAADYNWNSSSGASGTPDCVALWRLPQGMYYTNFETNDTFSMPFANGAKAARAGTFIISPVVNGSNSAKTIAFINSAGNSEYWKLDTNGQLSERIVLTAEDNLLSTSNAKLLSANQGRVLKGLIDDNLGKAKVLTSADYDYPTNNPDGVALWKLDPGIYTTEKNETRKIYPSSTNPLNVRAATIIVGAKDLDGYVNMFLSNAGTAPNGAFPFFAQTLQSTGAQSLFHQIAQPVINSLTSASTVFPLSANQGRILSDRITGLAISGSGAPTTATVGTVGKLYEDTANGKLYICTAVTDVSGTTEYTWEEVGAGGGSGITALTTADYNYDYGNTGTNNCVALWLLDSGIYTYNSGVVARAQVSTNEPLREGWAFVYKNNTTSTLYQSGSWIYHTSGGNSNVVKCVKTNLTTGTSITAVNTILTDSNIIQQPGNSTDKVMSQNAVTSMVFHDPGVRLKVQIGNSASATGTSAIAIGQGTTSNALGTVTIGSNSYANAQGAITLGPNSYSSSSGAIAIGSSATVGPNAPGAIALGTATAATVQGEINVRTRNTDYGYNNSNYRLLTGLYDPQSAHDAATKGYVDTAVASAGAPVYTNSAFNNLWENA